MLKAPQLQGAAELPKGHKRIEEYFVSANPLSNLVQIVIQSRSCFSIFVIRAARKKLAGTRSLKSKDRPFL